MAIHGKRIIHPGAMFISKADKECAAAAVGGMWCCEAQQVSHLAALDEWAAQA